jgi:hypothetical protein
MNGIFFSAIHVSTVRKLTLYSRATSRLVARLRGLLCYDTYKCSASQQEKLVF